MGYFDGLTDAIFKKDDQGRTLYYPWGILGKGYIIPDEAKRKEIRSFTKNYYIVSLCSIFAIFLTRGAMGLQGMYLLLFLAVISFTSWFILSSKKILRNCEKTSTKLKMGEAYQNSARSHNLPTLIILLILSLLFVAAGIALLLFAQDSKQKLAGLLTAGFFGLCTAAIAYMVRAKIKQKRNP